LGVAYDRLGWHWEALNCLHEGLVTYRQLGDRRSQADRLIHLSAAYRRLGQYTNAIACLDESLSICQQLGDRRNQANSQNHLGSIHLLLEQPAEAIDHQLRSLEIYRELDDRHGQVITLRDLGDALRSMGHHQEAQLIWQEALDISNTLVVPEADEIQGRLAAPPPSRSLNWRAEDAGNPLKGPHEQIAKFVRMNE
jgi:tetratricopeptide (TPR) repeat protein